MIVIVGHGPSIHSGLGSVIDSHTVVRLKDGRKPHYDSKHWGTRTDYLCARLPRYDRGRFPFWHLRASYDLYQAPEGKKPTTGLCAVLEAIERGFTDIAVIGFDRLMRPDDPDPLHTWLAHDKWAEHALIKKLGVKDLGEVR